MDEAYIRLIVSQDDENGGAGFSSYLIVGKPTTLKLQGEEKATLSFRLAEAGEIKSLSLNVQYFTGNASIQLKVAEDKIVDLINPSGEDKQAYGLETVQSMSSVSIAMARGLSRFDTY